MAHFVYGDVCFNRGMASPLATARKVDDSQASEIQACRDCARRWGGIDYLRCTECGVCIDDCCTHAKVRVVFGARAGCAAPCVSEAVSGPRCSGDPRSSCCYQSWMQPANVKALALTGVVVFGEHYTGSARAMSSQEQKHIKSAIIGVCGRWLGFTEELTHDMH